jgi:uncharacterized membrane protein YccC
VLQSIAKGADDANAVLKTVGPPLLFGVRLWASVCLALYVAFALELDNPYWAGTSAALVCQPRLGASLRKGWYRLIGTLVGAVFIVALTAGFPQNRVAFFIGLALWGGMSAFASTLLRNFAAYSAALAGYTAVIIAYDQLGAVGGLNGQAFILAVTRVSEIGIGILSAGLVLVGTNLGDASRRLARLVADIMNTIADRFTVTLASGGADFDLTQPLRRDLAARVIALDPVIDEGLGESPQLRYHSPVLQNAVDGLFAALGGWRAISLLLFQRPETKLRQEAAAVLDQLPRELRLLPEDGGPSHWTVSPADLRGAVGRSVRRLLALPAETPSQRVLAMETAEVLIGLSRALDGLALLLDQPEQPVPRGPGFRLRPPDWLPAALNALRAFLVIGAVSLFWIVTEWPNGALAIVWAAIVTILFAPRSDQAYGGAAQFTVGNMIAAAFAAIVAFAVLPQTQTFAGLAITLALYLVPAGALLMQPWRPVMFTAMAAQFVPLLAPANQENYDTVQFYNAALALVAGSTVGAFSFRLIPPLPPAWRAARLLRLTLRDLRRLATAATPTRLTDWQNRIYGRLAELPEQATPLQRAQLVAALSVGTSIIKIRRIDFPGEANTELERALTALADGNGQAAVARLAGLDRLLATAADTAPAILRARGFILLLSGALDHHPEYFNAATI